MIEVLVLEENAINIENPTEAIKGDAGLSAYEIAVKNGFEGSEEEWLISLKGEKGDTGEKGEKGDDGEDAPVNLSEFNNDAGFITNVVEDLANYYLKSETYTKNEVKELVSAIPKFSIEVVSALPSTNISATTVYLLTTETNDNSNLYTEYIYVNGIWEPLGTQTVDLINYYNKTEIDNLLNGSLKNTDVIDNLLSTSTNLPLSANQGSVLKGLVDGHMADVENPHRVTATQVGLMPTEHIWLNYSESYREFKLKTTHFKKCACGDGTYYMLSTPVLIYISDAYTNNFSSPTIYFLLGIKVENSGAFSLVRTMIVEGNRELTLRNPTVGDEDITITFYPNSTVSVMTSIIPLSPNNVIS